MQTRRMISLWDEFTTSHVPLVGYQVGLLRSASPNTSKNMTRACCEYDLLTASVLRYHFGSRHNFRPSVVNPTHGLTFVGEFNHS
jgi:hypothetical protein